MAELKVHGAPHLVRRSGSPGVVVNTNREAFDAVRATRARNEKLGDMEFELSILREQVSILASQLKNGGGV